MNSFHSSLVPKLRLGTGLRKLRACEDLSRDRQGAVVSRCRATLPHGRGSKTSQALRFLLLDVGKLGIGWLRQRVGSGASERASPSGAWERVKLVLACFAAFVACVSLAQADDAPKPKLFDRVQIKNEVGGDALEFKGKSDGAKVVDLRERELFRINLKGNKLKIKRPDESVVAYIVVKPGEFKVLDATEKLELFELQKQADGDWKLKDGNDKSLLRIKRRDYGFEIETPDDKSLFKSKLKDGKVSLRDANDKTVHYSKDSTSTLALSCLGFQPISELGVKAGLVAAVLWFESPTEGKKP